LTKEVDMSTKVKRIVILAFIAVFIMACSTGNLQKYLPKLGGDDKNQKQEENDQGQDENDAPGNSDNPNRAVTKKPKDKGPKKTEAPGQESGDESEGEGDQSQHGGSDTQPTQGVEVPTQVDMPVDFVLTDDATQVMVFGSGIDATLNFQTGLSLEEAMNFMRTALTAKGMSEDGMLSISSGDTFSMVFTGATNGMKVVVQGVKLAEGVTNINLRYEG
jgi:hypothetical protein